MGVRTQLTELGNRPDGQTFEVWEEADGSISITAGGKDVVLAESNPLTGGISYSTAGVDCSDSLGLYGIKKLNKAAIVSGIPVDFSTGSFVGVSQGGGSGSIDSTTNAYGSKTIHIITGGQAAAYGRWKKTLSPTQANMDIDGAPFLLVAELVRGFSDADTINITFSSDAFVTKSLSAAFAVAKGTRLHGNLYAFSVPASGFSATGGEVWANAMNYAHVGCTCATPTSQFVTIDIPTSTLTGNVANDYGVTLTTTGALPTGLAVATVYYAVNSTGSTFQLSATKGGAPITTTGTQSGVQTALTSGGELAVYGLFQYSKGRPKCVIDFDDAFISQYTQVFPYMAKHGLVGTIGVIAARVGTTGYCSEAQLTEMYNAGWDMAVHGDTPHSSFGTDALLTADIVANRDYVAARWPRAAKDYIYPAGIIGTNSKAILRSLGFRSARSTRFSLQATLFGVDDQFCLYGLSLSQSTTAATIVSSITSAKDSGSTIRLYGHRVVQSVSDATNEITIADFATVIDSLGADVAANKMDSLTDSQWSEAMLLS